MGRSRAEPQAAGFVRNKPVIDQVPLTETPGAINRTGVPDLVAGLKIRYLLPHRLNNTGAIPPQDLRLPGRRLNT